MTLRERIADWISGGALTEALSARDRNKAAAGCALDLWGKTIATNSAMHTHRFALQKALRAIAACEMPKSNANERRMASIAREALK